MQFGYDLAQPETARAVALKWTIRRISADATLGSLHGWVAKIGAADLSDAGKMDVRRAFAAQVADLNIARHRSAVVGLAQSLGDTAARDHLLDLAAAARSDESPQNHSIAFQRLSDSVARHRDPVFRSGMLTALAHHVPARQPQFVVAGLIELTREQCPDVLRRSPLRALAATLRREDCRSAALYRALDSLYQATERPQPWPEVAAAIRSALPPGAPALRAQVALADLGREIRLGVGEALTSLVRANINFSPEQVPDPNAE